MEIKEKTRRGRGSYAPRLPREKRETEYKTKSYTVAPELFERMQQIADEHHEGNMSRLIRAAFKAYEKQLEEEEVGLKFLGDYSNKVTEQRND